MSSVVEIMIGFFTLNQMRNDLRGYECLVRKFRSLRY